MEQREKEWRLHSSVWDIMDSRQRSEAPKVARCADMGKIYPGSMPLDEVHIRGKDSNEEMFSDTNVCQGYAQVPKLRARIHAVTYALGGCALEPRCSY